VDDLELISRFAPQQGPDAASRRRAEARLAEAISVSGRRSPAGREHSRRPRRGFALASAVVAAVALVALITTLWPATGGGVQNAYAAVERAGTATAAAARRSGTVIVLITHDGRTWASESVRWNGGSASVSGTGVGSPGDLLFVDGVLFTRTDGGWTIVNKDGLSSYMVQRYVGPALKGMSSSTFRRIVGGIHDLRIQHGQDGTTIYSGREAAAVITSDPHTGERIRVLPFGFVAHGAAANPASILDISLTVGSDGIIQRIVATWGTGASAWGFTVEYAHLGATPAITAPNGLHTLTHLKAGRLMAEGGSGRRDAIGMLLAGSLPVTPTELPEGPTVVGTAGTPYRCAREAIAARRVRAGRRPGPSGHGRAAPVPVD